MSGAPKRLHEEGGQSTPVKRAIEETSIYPGSSGKLIQPVGSEFNLPFDHVQDGRFNKLQRIDSRDDKRLTLTHSVAGNRVDHPVSSDSRPELRNTKDARDTMPDDWKTRTEIGDLYNDVKVDIQVTKAENNVKVDCRVEESVMKLDRRSYIDFKGDIRSEKGAHAATSAHLIWKDYKEHDRGKKYLESPSDGIESCPAARPGLLTTDESAKVLLSVEGQDFRDTHEAVGENKVDVKGDENFRDKDRKRKDEKHRDLGDRDKQRNDHQGSMQIGGASVQHKELPREDRDVGRWEREREDKERHERKKDLIKKESSNAIDKESLHIANGSARISVLGTATDEPQTLRDDIINPYERDVKDRKRERDGDVGDRNEPHNKCNDKESDDGCAEGEVEKDKEVFGSVQQRRRVPRSRGAPQAPNRDSRFRSRVRDNEGSQGKSEASAIVYKAGECMQEFFKSWKEFEASEVNKSVESLQNSPTLEIRIPAEFVTSTNRQVKGAQLWGTDIYTNDSDLVAVLMHTGYCCPTSSPSPPAIQELRATVRVLPPQDCYTSTLRNNVRSRAWGAGIGCSFRIECCCIIKIGGGTIDLEPRLTHMSVVEPTLAPVSVERTMTTRAAASSALRQQRFVREVAIQYNLCNEPWLKYSISIVADKGLKKSLYTSARLKKGEVIYLETHHNRYELCFNGEKPAYNGTICNSSQEGEMEQEKLQNHCSHAQIGDRGLIDREGTIDVYRWSRCKKAMPESIMHSIGIPLPVEHLEVLEEDLEWEDVQWSQTGVWVAGKEYSLARAHFLSPS